MGGDFTNRIRRLVNKRERQNANGATTSTDKAALLDVEAVFQATNTCYELTPSQLSSLVDSKNVEALFKIGGVQGIARKLAVDLAVGLAESARPASQHTFGKNILPGRAAPSLLQMMWEAFLDRTLLLLTSAALISLAIGIYQDISNGTFTHWIEGAAILVAVIIVVLVNALNDYQRERQFRRLAARAEDRTVNVLLNGEPARISIFDLAVGDICLLEPGVRVLGVQV